MTHERYRHFQRRLAVRMFLAVAPSLIFAFLFFVNWQATSAVRWTLFSVLLFFTCGAIIASHRYVLHSMRSVASMLESIRHGEFIFRGRHAQIDDALGQVTAEINLLSTLLLERRLGAMEAALLLDKLIAEVDIAVFAFDAQFRLKRVNKAGTSLLAMAEGALLGRTTDELGLSTLLGVQENRIEARTFRGGAGQWEIRYRQFREGGEPHHLLVITDLSRVLREQEREAWHRMVRVMGHEINNSLAPIKSISETLLKSFTLSSLSEEGREDAQRGLNVIRDRADALARFISGYARLARLPPPSRNPVEFSVVARQAASIFKDRALVESSPGAMVNVDADQIEQVLINLMKNAVEAIGEDGGVRIRWRPDGGRLVVEIEDTGCGLEKSEGLWVPFYTTKATGTGLGLVVSREIVENHGGVISLENRADRRGCIARIYLPLA